MVSLIASSDSDAAAGTALAAFTTWGFSLFAVLVFAALWRVRARTWRPVTYAAVVGGVSSVVAGQIGRLVQAAVAERRPCQGDPAAARWYPCPASYSFPSDHSIYAGALGVTAVVLGHLAARAWIGAAGVVLALMIGVSRVVLGVHYWWDVLAGLLFGAAFAGGALLAATRVSRNRGVRSRSV